MTAFARRMTFADAHLMEDGKICEIPLSFPVKGRGSRISERHNPLKMTRLARDTRMGVMGHLFIVGQVALSAVDGFLVMVCKGCGVFVTRGAVQACMGRVCIGFFIHQRDAR